MANNIGTVEFIVNFDGKTLPAQAKAIGQKMGQSLSRSMQTEFDRNMGAFANRAAAKLNVAGKKSGKEFANALDGVLKSRRRGIVNTLANMLGDREVFESFVRNSGSVAEGLDRVIATMEKARKQGSVNDEQFKSMNLTFRNWAGTMKDLDPVLEESGKRTGFFSRQMGKLGKSIKDTNKESKGFFGTWKSLPHGFRQFSFYVALFASLGTQISGLGSAAGSSLVVLSTAALALGVGFAAVAIGLQGITGDLKDLAPAAQPAIKAFRDLAKPFAELQKSVQGALFANLALQISLLATTLIPALNTGLTMFATTVNQAFSALLTGLTSARGVEVITNLFTGLQPILASLLSGILQLSGALGNIFLAAIPATQIFADKFLELMTTFLEWTSSLAGRNSLAEFFSNGVTIMGAVLPLLGAAGQLLNNLVTPETVTLLVQTLTNLTEFMPALGALLGAIGSLDPIGLIAQALNEIGKAFAPVMPFLQEFATILNGVLSSALSTLIPMLGSVIAAFAPLLPFLAKLAGELLDVLLPALQPIIDVLIKLAPTVMKFVSTIVIALMPIIEALTPIFDVLAETLLVLVESVLPVITTLIQALAPVILQVINALMPIVQTWFPLFGGLLGTVAEALMPLINAVLGLITPLLDLIDPLIKLIVPILPPLIDLLNFLIPIIGEGLAAAINFVIPVFETVIDVVKDLMPVFDSVIQVLTGVIDFLVGVFTGDWDRAWDGIKNIVGGQVNFIIGLVEGLVNGVISLINGMIKGVNSAGKNITDALGVPSVTIPLIGKVSFPKVAFARGGIADRATNALIGERGPEAVVPLHRPLGQVDPSVRDISALLQGKQLSNSASNSRSITVAEGAIVVVGSNSPGQTASAVLDRFVVEAAG